MKLLDAINLVLELAQQNVLSDSEVDDEPALIEQASRQQEAVNIVSDYVYNYLADKLAEEEDEECGMCESQKDMHYADPEDYPHCEEHDEEFQRRCIEETKRLTREDPYRDINGDN